MKNVSYPKQKSVSRSHDSFGPAPLGLPLAARDHEANAGPDREESGRQGPPLRDLAVCVTGLKLQSEGLCHGICYNCNWGLDLQSIRKTAVSCREIQALFSLA